MSDNDQMMLLTKIGARAAMIAASGMVVFACVFVAVRHALN